MSEYQTFVVPYDFSTHAEAALRVAVDLAQRLHADLHLVHVLQPPSYVQGFGGHGAASSVAPVIDMTEIREGAIRSLREVTDTDDVAVAPGRVEPHVAEGVSIADAIRGMAEKLDADLIVMGTHGRTGLSHVFLGSVAERTLRRAPCPVLVTQAEEDQAVS